MRGATDDDVEERGVELGLSLGANKNQNHTATARRGPPCRILTAKDFPASIAGPSRASRASPSPSQSSSVSSSSVRATDEDSGTDVVVGSTSPETGSGSINPSSSQTVVGWPPIKAFRMNSLFNLSKEEPANNKPKKANRKGHHISCSNGHSLAEDQDKSQLSGRCLYVKVNMDGDPIGRKVDLHSHGSYESLAISLELMFWGTTTSSTGYMKGSRLLDNSSEFVLTYKDKDGDWLLVGDVPWSMFLDTAKRLRIMRNSDASMLPLRFQQTDMHGGHEQS
ncbi:Auxin-responsive protein [Rhynchospora pubera]|uniref:Auxin-responsive protein n=1 Tax=Rhynchospora pubera TaxID=906938 RepID=A0AAV8F4C6_9POAL|nr:Auxin-responsive protein [Rhynchospora pubera]